MCSKFEPLERPVSAHVAQLVEHVLGKDEVIGSNPIVGSSLKTDIKIIADIKIID